jgi:hypothetical protein
VTPDRLDTSTLSTKLEEGFVSPLTAVRGSLEILRDFPDLELRERLNFVERALQECERLEHGIDELAAAVYAAGRRAEAPEQSAGEGVKSSNYARRITIYDELEVVEVDFGGLEFSNSRLVNEFFDVIEASVKTTGHRWYFLTNHKNVRIWPEAWVAFAHRGRQINSNYSLGTVRYQDDDLWAEGDPGLFASRAEALAKIEAMKLGRG